jgi:hypothetical protein
MKNGPPVALALGLIAAACGRESPPTPEGRSDARDASARPTGAPSPSQGPARPIAVFVFLDLPSGSPPSLAQAWARELEAVFAANPTQFTQVKTRGEAEVAVRIQNVIPTPDSPDHAVMSGAILIAEATSPFRLDYTGPPSAMAARFAKYLTGQVEAARAAARTKSPRP